MENNKSEDQEINPDKLPSAEPPYELLDLKLGKVKNWASGLPALKATLDNLVKEKTVVRGGGALFKMNQFDGFDCSSCAWPDPDHKRNPIAEYCENGAKALAEEATTKKIGADFFRNNSVFDLAKNNDYEIGHFGRITEPMYLPEGATHYQPISYEKAFEIIAKHLNQLPSPDNAAFYTSGRTSNEASFVYQLFVREFGTNNFPDCSNMCHETSGTALKPVLGLGKGSATLEDFYEAEVIIIIGQNPGTNSPRMLSALEKQKRNGGKIIAINPLPEAGLMGFRDPQNLLADLGKTQWLADIHFPVKINGDISLLKALEKFLYEFEKENPGKVFDHNFIETNTGGFDEFLKHLDTYDINKLAEESGVPLDDIHKAAELIKFKNKIIVCWGMGITQQPNGVDICREIVNLLLLKGSIGQSGAGTCPVRGHSNVQGNRTMLINNYPTQAQLDSVEKNFGFKVPRKLGYDMVESVKAIHEGKVKVLFCMGGNYLSAAPDTTYTANALRKLDLTVSVSTKLNRTHLIHGKESIILPTVVRSEKDVFSDEVQFVSTENSMGVIQRSRGVLKPVADGLMNETHIVCNMAKATLGGRSVVDWDRYMKHYDTVRDDIEKTIPGFSNYNVRVREDGGFYLPNPPRNGVFTSDKYPGRAAFTITDTPVNLLKDNEYFMATTRTHDQFNTTIYGLDDRYRGIFNERRVVLMNANDIKKAGLKAGDKVDLFNYDDDVERIAPLFIVVEYPIPPKNTVTYFPEANVLVSVNNVVRESNMPAYKYVKIQVKKHDSEIYQQIDELLARSLKRE